MSPGGPDGRSRRGRWRHRLEALSLCGGRLLRRQADLLLVEAAEVAGVLLRRLGRC